MRLLMTFMFTMLYIGAANGASPTVIRDLLIRTSIGYSTTTNSTTTGSAQAVAILSPITILTNSSLASVNNFTGNTGASQIIIKNGKASGAITLLNNTGGSASAEILTGTGADLDIPAGASVSLFYDSVNSRWQIYGGSGGGGVLAYGDFTKGVAPAAPAAGRSRLFVNTDGRPYIEDETGFFTDIGLASGTVGNREYITNPNARYGTDFWNLYNDSAAVPVDMTGGVTTGLTLTRTTSSSEYVVESQGFKLAKDAANRQGLGFSTDISIDRADLETQRPIWVSFLYKTSANYVSADMVCYAYDFATPGTPILITGGAASADAGKIQASTVIQTFTGFFTPSSNTSSSYRVGCHIATTNALAYNLFFGKFHAGSLNFVPGAIIGSQTSYTPTGSWTNTTYTGSSTRRGEFALINVKAVVTGATGTAQLTISLPPGQVVDTTKCLTQSIGATVYCFPKSSGAYFDDSAGIGYLIQPFVDITNSKILFSLLNVTTHTGTVFPAGTNITNLVPVTMAAPDSVAGWLEVPIVGWSATNMVATNDLVLTTPPPTTVTSAIKTPIAGNNYLAMTGNSVTLTPGTWALDGVCNYDNGGTTPAYTIAQCSWLSANGADGATRPAALSAAPGLTILGPSIAIDTYAVFPATAAWYQSAPHQVVKVTANTTVYLVAYEQLTTAANARVTNAITAIKQQDLTVVGLIPGTLSAPVFLTSGTTWTTPPTVNSETRLRITLLGGGGGGGGVKLTTGSKGAGGGGSGASCLINLKGLSGNTAYTIAIGGGGAGGTALGATGSAGGSTTIAINGTTYTAGGGAGGNGQTGQEVVGGGAPGSSTNCTVNGMGAYGGVGLGSVLGLGAAGGSPSVIGAGYSVAVGGTTGGGAATNYGAGGGGATSATTTGQVGGAGSQGFILIEPLN